MSYTLFISDLHLSGSRTDISQAFFSFLQQKITAQCDALYILGDFFEYWIGDDHQTPLSVAVAAALTKVSKNCPVYFIHGNRDFLLSQGYAKSCGMTLLPEQAIIDLYGRRTLILHGDSLCTLDVDYMKFRRLSRKIWWQKLMLSLPLFIRKKIAERARAKSQQGNQTKSMTVMDVTPFEVLNQMLINGVDLMIHGHTHRPGIHLLEPLYDQDDEDYSGENAGESAGEQAGGKHPPQRVVLGDWYTQGSYLIIDKDNITLHSLTLATEH